MDPATRPPRRMRLAADAALVGSARRFATAAAAELGADEDAQDAVRSLVSELVTNVVLHAGTDAVVQVRDGGDAVIVEVFDGSPVPAVQRRVTGGSTTGRGLRLLRALSHHSEVRASGEVGPDGKVTLFTVCKDSTPQVRRALAAACAELFGADYGELADGTTS